MGALCLEVIPLFRASGVRTAVAMADRATAVS
jgi:hypothetical protein